METFSQKTAIITGGASGIGRAVAKELVSRGAVVVIADLNIDLAEKTAQSLGKNASAVKLDVTDLEAVKNLVARTVKEQGKLDYMFNNAGINITALAHELPDEAWRKVIDVNLMGVVNGVEAAYPVMVGQEHGHIVNTSSLGGLIPVPAEIAYATCKHGVVGLSNTLRIEGKEYGVKVSVVCPGQVKTELLESTRMINFDPEKLPDLSRIAADVDNCAREIVKGVARNKATIIVPKRARSVWLLTRLSPGLTDWIWSKSMKSLLRAHIDS